MKGVGCSPETYDFSKSVRVNCIKISLEMCEFAYM